MWKWYLILPVLLPAGSLTAQSEAGYEQYHYIGFNQKNTVVPMIHFRDAKSWYGEFRYNYEEQNSFSMNGGRQFTVRGKVPFSITPLVGIVIGQMEGITFGCNTEASWRKLFFSSQAQYSFGTHDRAQSFFFNWSEAGIKPLPWIYAGLSIQHTYFYRSNSLLEKGVLLGFEIRRFSFPLYYFAPFSRQSYFVAGINWEWERKK